VIDFLDPINHMWDPSLACVMGGAVAFNLLSFPRILSHKTPLLGKSWDLPTKKDIDKPLVIGSAIFGIGWGLSGRCPGPGIVGIVDGDPQIWMWVAGMLVGMRLFTAWQVQEQVKQAKQAKQPKQEQA